MRNCFLRGIVILCVPFHFLAVTIFCNLWFCNFSLHRQHSGSHSMPHWLGEGRGGERAPGALTTPEEEGNANEITQKKCSRLVEAGWLVGKKQLLINCVVWLGFYPGLSAARQRLLPLTLPDSPLSFVWIAISISSLALYASLISATGSLQLFGSG